MKTILKNRPILITGIERSGSSIVAKILGLCGSFMGNVTEMNENRGIKKLVDSFYTTQLGVPSNGQFPLPEVPCLCETTNWDNLVYSNIEKDGYAETNPWLYKSSRIAQIWPIWKQAYPNAKWIIVRRRTGDIIHSCLKTGFMSAFKKENFQKAIGVTSEQEAWLWWVHQHEKRFVEMTEAGIDFKVIWPERMVYGDYSQIYDMLDWVGLQWDDKIVHLVEPLLRNSPQKERK